MFPVCWEGKRKTSVPATGKVIGRPMSFSRRPQARSDQGCEQSDGGWMGYGDADADTSTWGWGHSHSLRTVRHCTYVVGGDTTCVSYCMDGTSECKVVLTRVYIPPLTVPPMTQGTSRRPCPSPSPKALFRTVDGGTSTDCDRTSADE
jgi:hypothetical protein